MIELLPGADGKSPTVQIQGCLDVRNANHLQAKLIDLLASGSAAHIDCTKLESIDCACIQVLLATLRDARGPITIDVNPQSEGAKWFGFAGIQERLSAFASPAKETVQ